MKNILLILLFAGLTHAGYAQQQSAQEPSPVLKKMVMLGKRQGAGNVLRWGGTDYVTWQQMAEKGVWIERFTLTKGVADPASRKLLTTMPLKPQTLEQWKTQFTAQDTAAGAAAQALFGQAIPVPGEGGFEPIVALEMQQGMLHGIGMLMADWRPDLANVMALRLEDKDIQKELSYVYRLFAAQPLDSGPDTAYCIIRPTEKWRAPAITDLKADELEGKIKISWTDAGNLYPASGYFIERSRDGGNTFVRLNSQPFIKIKTKDSEKLDEDRIAFVDSVGVNYQPFVYRILPFNAFGETGPVEKTITAMARDRTPPPLPEIHELVYIEGIGLKIDWDMPQDDGALKGFFVGHSNQADVQFMPIHNGMLAPETRSFTDPTAQARGGVNYYVVTVIDTAGNAVTSLPRHYYVDDVTPPATPTNLKATIDSTGYLILSWKPNTEKDFMGYNVFFANAADHEFIQLNGKPLTKDTFIHDLDLHTLSEHIYYKVVAMDEAFNPSDFSAMLEVKKPDILPPAPPLIEAIIVSDKSIRIDWISSPSHDAFQSELFRKSRGESTWKLLGTFQQEVSTYTDTAIVVGQIYEYCLRAIDDDGLKSPYCTAHQGRAYPSFTGNGLQRFEVEKDKDNVLANISWQYKAQKDAQIYLYRAYNDGSLQFFAKLPSSETTFTDKAVQAGRRYLYAAKVVYDSGAESEMIKANEITFE